MTKDELNNEYFDWMYQLVCNEKYSRDLSYRRLLCYLHSKEFVYIIGMDGNRADDGINLRYRFGCENGYEEPMIATELDDRSCSILEMMIALSIRCEAIMDNPEIGNRTGQWFWNMIVSLGLGSMTDAEFDRDYAEDVIVKFINRDYEKTGEGGLFTVEHCGRDLRSVEIWYQMCWYLDKIIKENERREFYEQEH